MKNIDLSVFGLNPTEQEIYKASLQLGPATVNAVARTAKVKRTTAYFAVENLIEKGLLSERIKGAIKIIEAAEPEYLKELLNKEKIELEQKMTSASDLIAGLKTLVKKWSSYSEIKYFEGKKHIEKIFEDILAEKSDPHWFGTMSSALGSPEFQQIYQKFSKNRRKIGSTKSFVISDRHPYAKKLWFQEKMDFREFRFLPEGIETNGAIVIYGNKIALFSFGDVICATMIENKAISEMMKVMFKLVWDKSVSDL